jgi:hypothetical protein
MLKSTSLAHIPFHPPALSSRLCVLSASRGGCCHRRRRASFEPRAKGGSGRDLWVNAVIKVAKCSQLGAPGGGKDNV